MAREQARANRTPEEVRRDNIIADLLRRASEAEAEAAAAASEEMRQTIIRTLTDISTQITEAFLNGFNSACESAHQQLQYDAGQHQNKD